MIRKFNTPNSSLVETVIYDDSLSLMTVVLKDGDTGAAAGSYTYVGVTPDVYSDFYWAESAGNFYNTRIKRKFSRDIHNTLSPSAATLSPLKSPGEKQKSTLGPNLQTYVIKYTKQIVVEETVEIRATSIANAAEHAEQEYAGTKIISITRA